MEVSHGYYKCESGSAGPATVKADREGPDALDHLVTPSLRVPVPSKPHLLMGFGQKDELSISLRQLQQLSGSRRLGSKKRKRHGGNPGSGNQCAPLHACFWREPGVDEPHCLRLAELLLTWRRVTETSCPAVISKLRVIHRAGISECVLDAFESFQGGLSP